MNPQQHLTLAQSLPPRLLRFFQRYPPPALFPKAPAVVAPIEATESPNPVNPILASTTAPTDANAPAIEDASAPASAVPEIAPDAVQDGYHNPFQPRKNFRTGKWLGPVYGLRKQADLVKLAQQHGVLDLLPYTIKNPEVKEAKRLEEGLRVKGTGVGQKVKGKKWERTMASRLAERQKAMENMPALIQEWKLVSYTRRAWKTSVTNNCTEGTWPWLEEMAEWEGSQVVWRWLGWHVRLWGLWSIIPSTLGDAVYIQVCTEIGESIWTWSSGIEVTSLCIIPIGFVFSFTQCVPFRDCISRLYRLSSDILTACKATDDLVSRLYTHLLSH